MHTLSQAPGPAPAPSWSRSTTSTASPHSSRGQPRGGRPAHRSRIVHACPRAADVGPGHDAQSAPEHSRVRARKRWTSCRPPKSTSHAIGPGLEVRLTLRAGQPLRVIRSEARRASLTVLGRGSAHRRSVTPRRHRPVRLTGQCGRLHRPDVRLPPANRVIAILLPGQGSSYGARRPRRGTDHGTTTQVAGDRDGGLVRHLAGGSGRIDPEGPGAHVRRRRPRDAVHGRAFIDATAGRGPHRSDGRARRHTPRPGPCRDRTPSTGYSGPVARPRRTSPSRSDHAVPATGRRSPGTGGPRHVLGLDHVDSSSELMFHDNVGRTTLGLGDLEGLRLLGRGPCL